MAYPTNNNNQNTESLSVTTYNCFADEYMGPWKAVTSPQQQAYAASPNRQVDIITKVTSLNSDVICLQEVSAKNINTLYSEMAKKGYFGIYEQGEQKPDGCAVFYKNSKFNNPSKEVLHYRDGTGRLALFIHLKTAQGNPVTVCTTHLAGGHQNIQLAQYEIQQVISKVSRIATPVIICGDFNFIPADSRFGQMQQAAFADTLKGQNLNTSIAASASGANKSRMDYIWHSRAVNVTQSAVTGNLDYFFSQNEPSDHLPVSATLNIPSQAPQIHFPSSTTVQNPFPAASFKGKLFAEAQRRNNSLNLAGFQHMLNNAENASSGQRGTFIPHLFRQIALLSQTYDEAKVLSEAVNTFSPSNTPFQPRNIQQGPFRIKLMHQFNQSIPQGLSADIYNVLATEFETLLQQSELEKQNTNGNFLQILNSKIVNLPGRFVQQLFQNAVTPAPQNTTQYQSPQPHTPMPQYNAPQTSMPQISQPSAPQMVAPQAQPIVKTTVIRVQYDLKGGKKLFVRGDIPGVLGWDAKGAKEMTPGMNGFWELKIPGNFNDFEFKFVIDNDDSKWESGQNHKISCGKTETITPNS